MCNIEQNEAGEYFAIAYQDNGEFAVLVLDSLGQEVDLL